MSIGIEPVSTDSGVTGASDRGERAALHAVRGELTFATAASAHAIGIEVLAHVGVNGAPRSQEVIVLDCASVTEADSAGLAVLLDWRREALQRGIALRYRNLPAAIAQLARISGVETLLTAD